MINKTPEEIAKLIWFEFGHTLSKAYCEDTFISEASNVITAQFPSHTVSVPREKAIDLLTGGLPYITDHLTNRHLDTLCKWIDSYLDKVFAAIPTVAGETELIAFAKRCFYKGFDKCENDDANCYTAWREEASKLIESLPAIPPTVEVQDMAKYENDKDWLETKMSDIFDVLEVDSDYSIRGLYSATQQAVKIALSYAERHTPEKVEVQEYNRLFNEWVNMEDIKEVSGGNLCISMMQGFFNWLERRTPAPVGNEVVTFKKQDWDNFKSRLGDRSYQGLINIEDLVKITGELEDKYL